MPTRARPVPTKAFSGLVLTAGRREAPVLGPESPRAGRALRLQGPFPGTGGDGSTRAPGLGGAARQDSPSWGRGAGRAASVHGRAERPRRAPSPGPRAPSPGPRSGPTPTARGRAARSRTRRRPCRPAWAGPRALRSHAEVGLRARTDSRTDARQTGQPARRVSAGAGSAVRVGAGCGRAPGDGPPGPIPPGLGPPGPSPRRTEFPRDPLGLSAPLQDGEPPKTELRPRTEQRPETESPRAAGRAPRSSVPPRMPVRAPRAPREGVAPGREPRRVGRARPRPAGALRSSAAPSAGP